MIYALLIPLLAKTGDDGLQMLMDLVRYLAFCVTEGDWLNDWLTHLPATLHDPLIAMGHAIAIIFGG